MFGLFFADDSRQKTPSRPGMGPLVAAGGLYVPYDRVRRLERELDDLCSTWGFPQSEPFKWSPGPELWMYKHLVGSDRLQFFKEALQLAQQHGSVAAVVVEDSSYERATGALTPEADVTCLLMERVQGLLGRKGAQGLIIADRPGGDRKSEERFLRECLETLLSGTDYVEFDRISLNVLCGPSKLIRLLQLADVVTSCTTAAVGGEQQHAPPVFGEVKKLLDTPSPSRGVGGYGLKLQPALRYANLYHWVAGDSDFWQGTSGWPLPSPRFAYSRGPFQP